MPAAAVPPYPVRVAVEYVSCTWECGDCGESGRVAGLAPVAYGGAAHTARTGHTVTEEVTRRKVIAAGEPSERLPPRREPVEAGSLG